MAPVRGRDRVLGTHRVRGRVLPVRRFVSYLRRSASPQQLRRGRRHEPGYYHRSRQRYVGVVDQEGFGGRRPQPLRDGRGVALVRCVTQYRELVPAQARRSVAHE